MSPGVSPGWIPALYLLLHDKALSVSPVGAKKTVKRLLCGAITFTRGVLQARTVKNLYDAPLISNKSRF